mmetsp:Transcript_12278/g.30971  ORF Transcript_12278/g.30971 Transcript_12278/m.30971 type:complete len:162 (+) Transcript_12278:108-593(+)
MYPYVSKMNGVRWRPKARVKGGGCRARSCPKTRVPTGDPVVLAALYTSVSTPTWLMLSTDADTLFLNSSRDFSCERVDRSSTGPDEGLNYLTSRGSPGDGGGPGNDLIRHLESVDPSSQLETLDGEADERNVRQSEKNFNTVSSTTCKIQRIDRKKIPRVR